jgi:uncharacterized LabA/DUF88 family protein
VKKVSIFVDVQNVYYTTRDQYQRHFDYNAFWALATQGRKVIHAFAYAIARDNEKQRQFQNILRGIGFEVKLKPYIQRSDGSAKGDWDVGITLDMMECAAQSDVIILVSGDGDFAMLLDRIQQSHVVETEVYGVPALTASALIQSAGRYQVIDKSLLLATKR